jgi:hypothetical protein
MVSCGHGLDYETLDSIDEVWRSQDQKAELSCFYPKLLFRRNFPEAILPNPLFLRFTFPDDIYFLDQSHFPVHLNRHFIGL